MTSIRSLLQNKSAVEALGVKGQSPWLALFQRLDWGLLEALLEVLGSLALATAAMEADKHPNIGFVLGMVIFLKKSIAKLTSHDKLAVRGAATDLQAYFDQRVTYLVDGRVHHTVFFCWTARMWPSARPEFLLVKYALLASVFCFPYIVLMTNFPPKLSTDCVSCACVCVIREKVHAGPLRRRDRHLRLHEVAPCRAAALGPRDEDDGRRSARRTRQGVQDHRGVPWGPQLMAEKLENSESVRETPDPIGEGAVTEDGERGDDAAADGAHSKNKGILAQVPDLSDEDEVHHLCGICCVSRVI